MSQKKNFRPRATFDRRDDATFERRLGSLFDNTPYLIFSFDLDGYLMSANRAIRETFGYKSDEIDGLHLRDLIAESHMEMIQKKLGKRRRGRQNPTPYEVLTRGRNGEDIWLEVSTVLILEDKEPIGIHAVARNINAQKAAERKLQESERRFREIAELLPGIICEMDRSFQFTYVNKAGHDIFGYTVEEMKEGVSVGQVIAEEDMAEAQKGLIEITQGKTRQQTVYKMKTRDGKILDMLTSSSPIVKDGEIAGIRTCLLDISELRKAEYNLRESEDRFRRIFAESPLGIAITNKNGLLRHCNQSFSAMFDLDPEDKSQDINILELAQVSEKARQKLATRAPIDCNGWSDCADETTPDSGDSARRYHEWHITPLGQFDGRSEEAEILVQVQDLTEKKRAQEAQLKTARDETEQARSVIRNLRAQLTEEATFHNMVSRSKDMLEIFDILPQIADTPASVLVLGESGTGKELIARSLHELGPRREGPFVAINCAALQDTLLESELFGHKKGAFTGAYKDKSGRFTLAKGGTLFLDEIGDISLAAQAKLLRVLNDGTYEQLGGTETLRADVRLVCATNKNLLEMVSQETFREDLYYRIKVVKLELPPLRKRIGDIPLLCDHFIRRFNEKYNRHVREVAQSALEPLLSHNYPGNIRELENIVEHAFVFCRGDAIEVSHLPSELVGSTRKGDQLQALSNISSFAELERLYIESILSETEGNKLEAAKRLGIHKTTFFRKLKKLGIGS